MAAIDGDVIGSESRNHSDADTWLLFIRTCVILNGANRLSTSSLAIYELPDASFPAEYDDTGEQSVNECSSLKCEVHVV